MTPLTLEQRTLIREARTLIATPEQWTQFHEARMDGAHGPPVSWDDRFADCWCLTGALRRAARTQFDYDVILNALDYEVVERTSYLCVADFNDNSTHAEVLAFLDTVGAEEMQG